MDLAYPARFEAEAVDCLTSVLSFRMSHGELLPLPSPPQPGEWPVVPEMAIAMKAALHQAMAQQCLSATDLAAALGTDLATAQSLLDPAADNSADRLEAALRAVGKRVLIEIADAV